MFNEGYGYGTIFEELNLHGYKNKVGNSFNRNSITALVRNGKYVGVYIFNKLVSKDYRGKRNGNSYKDIEEVIRVEGAVPPIITKEEYQAAQNKIKDRKHSRAANNAKEVYLLSGKFVCGECLGAYIGSRKFTGRNKKLQVTYRCNNRKSKHSCMNKEIRREYIEAFVLYSLATHIFDEKLPGNIVDAYKKYQKSQFKDVVKDRDDLKNRLDELDLQIKKVVDVIVKSGSEVLVQKLSEIEIEKIHLYRKH